MPRIKVDSISLNYELSGSGPVVVFINGLTMDLNGWLFQVAPFAKRYTLLRYDCRGQGASDKPDGPYSQKMHAEDLAGLMDVLGIEKAHVAGLSNGGMIAQHFALLYPERLGALVLTDTSSHVKPLLRLTIESWIKAAEAGGSALRYDVALPWLFSESFTEKNLEKLLAMRETNIINNPVRTLVNLSRASAAHDLKDWVSGIKAPTLIISGEEDILIPPKYARELREKIKGSTLVILKDCGHAPPIEKPDEFNEIAIEFLKRHDGLLKSAE